MLLLTLLLWVDYPNDTPNLLNYMYLENIVTDRVLLTRHLQSMTILLLSTVR